MSKLKITASFLVIASLFISCKKNEPTGPNYVHWPVVEVNGAQQANIGQAVSLQVSWPYSSGCDIMDKFAIKKFGNSYQIKALGYYDNVICTQDAGIKTRAYPFIESAAGNYELNFENPDGSVITHTILVQ